MGTTNIYIITLIAGIAITVASAYLGYLSAKQRINSNK